MSSALERRGFLLDRIRHAGGKWPVGRAMGLYRSNGIAPCRTTARKDLQYWERHGRLTTKGPDNNRYFVLNVKAGAR